MILIYSPASFHLRYIFPLFTGSAEIIQHGASEVLFIEEHTAGIVVLRASPLCCTCSISHPHNSLIPLLCLQILKLSFPSLSNSCHISANQHCRLLHASRRTSPKTSKPNEAINQSVVYSN